MTTTESTTTEATTTEHSDHAAEHEGLQPATGTMVANLRQAKKEQAAKKAPAKKAPAKAATPTKAKAATPAKAAKAAPPRDLTKVTAKEQSQLRESVLRMVWATPMHKWRKDAGIPGEVPDQAILDAIDIFAKYICPASYVTKDGRVTRRS